MAFDDTPADGQSDSRSSVAVPLVEVLKNLEDPLSDLRVDADAVVPHRGISAVPACLGRDLDAKRFLAPKKAGPP